MGILHIASAVSALISGAVVLTVATVATIAAGVALIRVRVPLTIRSLGRR